MDYENMEYPKDGDFYCNLCECHTNGFQSYESHINGLRHAKNLRKLGKGKMVNQTRYVRTEDRESHLDGLLKDANCAVIGLDKITEKHRWNSTIIFNCNACGGTFSTSSIVEHILSSKHRITIIGRQDPSWCAQISGMKLLKEIHESLVEERALEFQKKHGTGKPELLAEKSCLGWRECDKYMSQHTEKAYNAAHPDATPGSSVIAATAAASSSDEDESYGGISDIDLERDSDMISIDMKLEIFKQMIHGIKIRPDDEALALGYVELLKKFTFVKLLRQVRQLPPVKFNKLANQIQNDSTVFDEFVKKNNFWYNSRDQKPEK